MNKIKRYITIVFILTFFISFFPLNIKADEGPKQGDLRCPEGVSENECKKINDDTVEVYLEGKDGVKVTKIISKTKKLGEYEVKIKA